MSSWLPETVAWFTTALPTHGLMLKFKNWASPPPAWSIGAKVPGPRDSGSLPVIRLLQLLIEMIEKRWQYTVCLDEERCRQPLDDGGDTMHHLKELRLYASRKGDRVLTTHWETCM